LTSDNAKNILDITGGSAEDKIMAEIEEKSFIQKLQHDFFIFEETESFSANDKYFFKRIREKATFSVV
jgi:hypothetical protein